MVTVMAATMMMMIISTWYGSCSASDSAYFCTFDDSVVTGLSACYILAPCLNHSTDLAASWQVHCWGPNDTGVADTPVEGEIWSETPSQSMQNLQIAAKLSVICCHLANTNKELGLSARAIPPFAKLLWLDVVVIVCSWQQFACLVVDCSM